MKKTIGGHRLGSGKKMQVDLKTYNRSTHDLGYIWRSTMSAGTLVPFLKELALPGDTFDIDLEIDVKTHPTIGPLFGSYKVQLDVFTAPIRLYQSGLHNNALGIGMKMAEIKLPQLRVPNPTYEGDEKLFNESVAESLQNEPSSLLAHLDILGGTVNRGTKNIPYREFNAVPYLAYYDIYKNYYANKQEERGMFINQVGRHQEIVNASIFRDDEQAADPLPFKEPYNGTMSIRDTYRISVTFDEPPTQSEIDRLRLVVTDNKTGLISKIAIQANSIENSTGSGVVVIEQFIQPNVPFTILGVYYPERTTPELYELNISEFPLDNIDDMREAILATGKYSQFTIDNTSPAPYGSNVTKLSNSNKHKSQFSQQGLALKTYQSDLFNNWMSHEWVDNATTGINAITAVDTSEGSFTLDALNLAGKVYDMLNRIAISGGTYDDWLQTVYTHEFINRSETPVYHGGLSRELVFQEVVSVSEAETSNGTQPLGTLAGKGVMAQRKKGGHVVIKIDEPSYIMGIVSLTPRVDYSQGNKWDVNLKTMDDFHKPALDEIGFQDLIAEQMAWWTTEQYDVSGKLYFKSVGKQPAWINYMTNVNKVRGNFAKIKEQMFMTLNRRYEASIWEVPHVDDSLFISDMTTYIDPAKFNFIFADTDLTSQNFWVQIATDITARRKMSAKIMPNL